MDAAIAVGNACDAALIAGRDDAGYMAASDTLDSAAVAAQSGDVRMAAHYLTAAAALIRKDDLDLQRRLYSGLQWLQGQAQDRRQDRGAQL